MVRLRSGLGAHQVFSWLLSAVMIPATMLTFRNFIPPYTSIAVPCLYFVVYIQVIYLTIYEPANEELKKKVKYEKYVRKPFEGGPGRHTIVDSFCVVCEVRTGKETKHCRRCNFCIDNFDHHCVWLNNCIGGKNYWQFVVLVVCVCVFSLFAAGLSIYVLYDWISSDEEPGLTVIVQQADWWKLVWLLSCLVSVFIYGVLAATTTHLIWFHIHLIKIGQSTYRYMTNQKRTAKVSRVCCCIGRQVGTISHVSDTHSNTHRIDGASENIELQTDPIAPPPCSPSSLAHIRVQVEPPTPSDSAASYSNAAYVV